MVSQILVNIGSGNGLPPVWHQDKWHKPMMDYCQLDHKEKNNSYQNQYATTFCLENGLENSVCKMAAILFGLDVLKLHLEWKSSNPGTSTLRVQRQDKLHESMINYCQMDPKQETSLKFEIICNNFCQENALEIGLCKMATTLFRPKKMAPRMEKYQTRDQHSQPHQGLL